MSLDFYYINHKWILRSGYYSHYFEPKIFASLILSYFDFQSGPLEVTDSSDHFRNPVVDSSIIHNVLRNGQFHYSVSHNFIATSRELYSKIALGQVGLSLP